MKSLLGGMMPSDKTQRLFVAIDLPVEVKNEVLNIENKLRKLELIKGSFTPRDKLHLTLRFLGDVEDHKVHDVIHALKLIRFSSFDLQTGKVGAFTNEKGWPRIIWLELVGDALFALQAQIAAALEPLLGKEDHDFAAHVTIARVKWTKDHDKVMHAIEKLSKAEGEGLKVRVDRFVLKRSELRPEGSVYTDVQAFKSEA